MSMLSTLKGLLRTGRRSNATIKEPSYRRPYRMSIADWLIYHQRKIHFKKMSWMGLKILKNPLDCWIYQEIIWNVRPDIVVEIGSLAGGSTLFFCHMLDLLGHGQVVSIDKDRSCYQAKHSRLVDLTGDCADPSIVDQVRVLCNQKRTLVVHDADHTKEAVLRDLRTYSELIAVGSYFIVEDGVVDVFGRRSSKLISWDNGPGPLAAIRQFLKEDDRFVVDKECERYLITCNPCGFLKRVA
jgi:cephalosporin hydroxylase